jgi:hypothetical protein
MAGSQRSGRNRSLLLVEALWELLPSDTVDHGTRVCDDDLKFVPGMVHHEKGVNGYASARDRISTGAVRVHLVIASFQPCRNAAVQAGHSTNRDFVFSIEGVHIDAGERTDSNRFRRPDLSRRLSGWHSIATLGTQYVLGLKAVNCRNGETLDEEQVKAARKEDVLNALTVIASNFRTRVGESPATIREHDTPLEQATTSSLDALQRYTAGVSIMGQVIPVCNS